MTRTKAPGTCCYCGNALVEYRCTRCVVTYRQQADGSLVPDGIPSLPSASRAATQSVEGQDQPKTRGWIVLLGLAALAFVVISIASNESTHNDSRGRTRTAASRSTGQASSRSSSAAERERLRYRAEALTAHVEQLRLAMEDYDSRLGSIASQIHFQKSLIDGMEQSARMGYPVNPMEYQFALDQHNRLVREYNAILPARDYAFQQYETEVALINELVRQHNASLGR